ncbi:hypothetical protein NLG97_g4791 [Lecanicillium saksenae]|uniref:Uncharacterized protein n=1 Tax=Lecanicillium saksenae TaxID=468837 RepID=A0ACC1QUG1_9HYPO|nr:hypothetical protein NLG97_g4791 [Lecanicillium saksenae]
MTYLSSFFCGSPQKYKYTPLPRSSRTFRVAKLLPPEPALLPICEPTIRISLLECDTDTASPAFVDYDALSYAWDVPLHLERPNRRIIVESGDERFSMYIYRPLEVALLHFAAANAGNGESRYDIPIFIDQICINQEDDVEKAHQLPLMQDIYSQCRRAVIWLGPGTAYSDLWFRYVRDVCNDGILGGLLGPRVASVMRVFRAAIEPSVALTDPVELQDRADLVALIDRLASKYPIDAFLHVFQRTWFKRLWTIQEACLASDVVLVCGDERLCFDCFRAGCFFYNIQNGWWLHENTETVSKQELNTRNAAFHATEGFRRIFQERNSIHQLGYRKPLHELVISHSLVNEFKWKVGASLAQDRIYGLLGLTAVDDAVRRELGIHYDKTNQPAALIKAYTEATGLFLQQGQMEMLLFNQTPKKSIGLPSWTPDWAADLVLPVSWVALHQPIFAAGGSHDISYVKADAPKGTINIKGAMVGGIAAVGKATYTVDTHPQVTQQVEFGSVKPVFDEIDQFVKVALSPKGAAPKAEDSLEETMTWTSLRVCDSGRTARHLCSQLGSRESGMTRLQALRTSIAHLSGRVLRDNATKRAYSLLNIYATVGITPWYFDYYRSTTVLHRLARGPVPVARTIILALAELVDDATGICSAWAYFWLHTAWNYIKKRLARNVTLSVSKEHIQNAGLDPNAATGQDMTTFRTNLLLNTGRRVFRTEEGHVGMGPGEIQAGDVVTVVYGLSTPLVLRSKGKEWMLVGEAYCEGVMDGEAIGVNEREFVLV